jgi:uncharacterized protein (TIGR03437 family)
MPRTFLRAGLLTIAGLLFLCAVCAAQPVPPIRPLTLYQSTYRLRPGESTQVSVSADTLEFLQAAPSRTLTIHGDRGIEGKMPDGLVISPNRDGTGVVLGAALRTKPGAYTVDLSATAATGEQRAATLAVVVDGLTTVPVSATRPPVVLLNGWIAGFTNACPVATSSADTFGNLAQYLVSDGVPVVYLFDNCLEGANFTIENLAANLGTFLNSITYDDGTQVPQIDLVAHSMGGLIVRAYLAGLQPTGALAPPATTLVRDLVMIAVPNFGSFLAGNYAVAITPGTQSSELIPASSFLWNLATWNQREDDLRGVDAIAVIGNAGAWTGGAFSSTSLANASDGVVSTTSASLDFILQGPSVTRIVPYCHVDPFAFTNTNFGTFACNAPGIANVTDTSQETGQIVRSFLSGTTAWESIGTTPATDPYLATDGGWYFTLVSEQNQYLSDLTEVAWGTVQLQTGGDGDEIYYGDFISGTGTFEVTSTSAGTFDCGTVPLPPGYYSAARCKIDTAIFSVGPLAIGAGLIVDSGSTIVIKGNGFGNSQCSGCKVEAAPASSATPTVLQVSSWSNTSISAILPSSFSGLVAIAVLANQGGDAINIMTVSASAIALSPANLNFGYTLGASAPPAQTIQLTAGTLAWTAAASTSSAGTSTGSSWLSVSPTSGTAPSSLSVSVSAASLAAGTYTGTIQITSSGVSNSPLSVTVTLTVAGGQPALAVTPGTLGFSYTYGDAVPAAQTVSIANSGAGTLSWTASDTDFWVALSSASGSGAATLSITVNPANLAAGTYNSTVTIAAAGATGSPATVAVTLVVTGQQPAGTIAAAVNAADYQPAFASATWVAIFGTNLSQTTATWGVANFVNGALPTSLDGVSVTIDGVPAYVEYISPTQINVLAPDDSMTGPVAVQVTTAQQASNSFSAAKQQFAPAFFTIDNGAYVAAEHAGGALIGQPNLLGAGVTTLPASPGEVIQIYGTGFGPTNPATPTADLVAAAAMLANSVQVAIGGMTANVIFAGLVESGLYQFNVTVPNNLPAGDASITASIGGLQTQTGLLITIQ